MPRKYGASGAQKRTYRVVDVHVALLAELEIDVFDGAQAAWIVFGGPVKGAHRNAAFHPLSKASSGDQILGQGNGGRVAVSICNANFDGKGGCRARVDPDVAQFEDDEGGIGLGRWGQWPATGSS